MIISCYIVDDESHAIDVIKQYIEKTPGLSYSGSTLDPVIAVTEINILSPTVVFIDIDMPVLNGFQVAGKTSVESKIILTTAFRQFGPEAFELGVIDYLLKPISYERFLLSINRLRDNNSIDSNNNTLGKKEESLFIKTNNKGKLLRVNIAEIIYISASLNYIEFHLKDQKILTYLTLGEAMAYLSNENFIQIHKSYIINMKYFEVFDYGQIELTNKIKLPVGRTFKEKVLNSLSGITLVSRREKNTK